MSSVSVSDRRTRRHLDVSSRQRLGSQHHFVVVCTLGGVLGVAEIELRVGQSDEMRMRVGASPLLSVATGVYEMLGPGSYRVPSDIVATARRLAQSLNLEALRPLAVPAARSVGVPEFITPFSGPGFGPLASALDRLRDTPTDMMLQQIETYRTHTGRRDGFGGWSKRPRHHLTAFVAALSEFERAVFRPLVPHFDARLRTQVENLAVAVGTGQGAAVLSAVHPSLTRQDDTLRWPIEIRTGPPPVRSMVIYPMAASTRCILASDDGESDGVELHEVSFGLTVPALAVRSLPQAGGLHPRDTPLTALLGPARASALTAVSRTEGCAVATLSAQLRRPPSTVSHDLGVLRGAGLVQTARVGPNVVYRTTIAGRRILTAWE
ncbi:MAG: ArsR/SmtB family transcription factor [Dermatophilaceae bacterium]